MLLDDSYTEKSAYWKVGALITTKDLQQVVMRLVSVSTTSSRDESWASSVIA